jgi:hypothetical protein
VMHRLQDEIRPHRLLRMMTHHHSPVNNDRVPLPRESGRQACPTFITSIRHV